MDHREEIVYDSASAGTAAPITDDRIYSEIHAAILDGRLAPGAKLGQDELGEVFGVSKTRIRPILYRLADQKMVVIEPMRGAFVARPSIEDARAVNAARQVLEEGVIRAVTRSATPRDIRRLKGIVAAEGDARRRGDGRRAHNLTGDFHVELARICGNPEVTRMVTDLVSRDSLAVALYQRPSSAGCSLDDHARLIERIAAGDEDGAAEALRRHLREVMASLDLGPGQGEHQPLKAVFGEIGGRP